MGGLKAEWHDMDFVIAAFGRKKPLVSKFGGPYNGEAAVRHYQMALGKSVASFAPDARCKRPTRHESRKLGITSPLLQELANRQTD